LRLFFGQDVSTAAVFCAQPQHILTSEARNRTFYDGGAPGSRADFLGCLQVDTRIGWPVHHPERLLHALFGDDAPEGRLLKLHRQALAKRAVKHRVAGRIGEVGKHKRIGFGERPTSMEEVWNGPGAGADQGHSLMTEQKQQQSNAGNCNCCENC
jgi:hypothetical protein